MKARTLNLLVGIGGTLCVAGLASGAFVGVKITGAQNPFNMTVVRIYAEFDNIEQDHMLAVAGTPDSPLYFRWNNGDFYQHVFGSDTAPLENIVVAFPSLAFDTFVSIGRLTETQSAPDTTQLSKGWPGFADCSLIGSSLSWSVDADDPQGAPGPDGRVFIGQFTTDNGYYEGGRLLIKAVSDGDPSFQAVVSLCHFIPCQVADITQNGCVDRDDFMLVLELWGSTDGCRADIDGDGNVGITDLLIVLADWTLDCDPNP